MQGRQPLMTELSHIDTTVTLSPSAARQIARLAQKEARPGAMLRISVTGGGCSGFQYHYEFVWEKDPADLVVEQENATLLVDDISLELMKGCVVDYESNLAGSAFVIKNPNATSSCGCGNSFSA